MVSKSNLRSIRREFDISLPSSHSKKSEIEMAEQQQRELSLDLEELRQLETIAKRPRVASLISSEIRSIDFKLSSGSRAPIEVAREKAPAVAVAAGALNYVTLDSFSWEQDTDKIKMYVFLEGVEQEKVETIFKPKSMDIKFHDVQGKNYKCVIPKLNKEIVPEKCKLVVKPNKVIITLFKASEGNWIDLHFKEDKMKPNLDKDKDPMAGIMDLMKNMYEEGDDEMKRTIAKAWTDARSGKATDSLRGL